MSPPPLAAVSVDPRFGPGEGAILFSAAEAATSTESLSLADVPLEDLWGVDTGPVAPVLAVTGTVSYDLPLADHPSVEDWVRLFAQAGGRGAIRTWLARSTRYVPLFYEILDRYQLPRDLVFLAMVESGFSPRAFSWATASGPWQFMPVTGKRYGLRIGFWVDERRDFVKSTHAAARHLRWLYSVFQDWHLAMAAYNAGAGGIRSAMRRSGAKSFWRLRSTRRIRRETKGYVPKILASAIVSKRPENYGLVDVPYQPALAWDTVTVERATALSDLGEACGGLPGQALEDLNPELRVGVTPPGETWEVRVPKGFGGGCADGLRALPEASRWTFRYYEAQEGESLHEIARRHGTTEQAILRFHDIEDSTKLDFFAELAVPVPFDTELPIAKPPERRRGGAYGPGKARMI
ncbi:MAG: transglycosylase SLT domain-containing protein, partial [Myxococcota bacterium]